MASPRSCVLYKLQCYRAEAHALVWCPVVSGALSRCASSSLSLRARSQACSVSRARRFRSRTPSTLLHQVMLSLDRAFSIKRQLHCGMQFRKPMTCMSLAALLLRSNQLKESVCIVPAGAVEIWLLEVEGAMKRTLHRVRFWGTLLKMCLNICLTSSFASFFPTVSSLKYGSHKLPLAICY